MWHSVWLPTADGSLLPTRLREWWADDETWCLVRVVQLQRRTSQRPPAPGDQLCCLDDLLCELHDSVDTTALLLVRATTTPRDSVAGLNVSVYGVLPLPFLAERQPEVRDLVQNRAAVRRRDSASVFRRPDMSMVPAAGGTSSPTGDGCTEISWNNLPIRERLHLLLALAKLGPDKDDNDAVDEAMLGYSREERNLVQQGQQRVEVRTEGEHERLFGAMLSLASPENDREQTGKSSAVGIERERLSALLLATVAKASGTLEQVLELERRLWYFRCRHLWPDEDQMLRLLRPIQAQLGAHVRPVKSEQEADDMRGLYHDGTRRRRPRFAIEVPWESAPSLVASRTVLLHAGRITLCYLQLCDWLWDCTVHWMRHTLPVTPELSHMINRKRSDPDCPFALGTATLMRAVARSVKQRLDYRLYARHSSSSSSSSSSSAEPWDIDIEELAGNYAPRCVQQPVDAFRTENRHFKEKQRFALTRVFLHAGIPAARIESNYVRLWREHAPLATYRVSDVVSLRRNIGDVVQRVAKQQDTYGPPSCISLLKERLCPWSGATTPEGEPVDPRELCRRHLDEQRLRARNLSHAGVSLWFTGPVGYIDTVRRAETLTK